jgi:tRNA pseudouridine55 synthase
VSKRSDSGLDGILLVDKPQGWTSHDVVAKVRRITGQRRIGHTGTLDPMATGLLVLCLGNATRLVEFLTGHDKRYTGTVTLGRTTTTDDAEGETLAEFQTPTLNQPQVDAVAARFQGEQGQTPPAYSALKVAGRRAYALARAGEAPQLPARRVTIHAFESRLAGPATIAVDVTCSSGTYIRSLARDVAVALGSGGHLSALRRERVGPFSLGDAMSLESIEAATAAAELEALLIPADEGICGMDAAIIEASAALAVANGIRWNTPNPPPNDLAAVRIYAASGSFIGVGSVSSFGEIHASKVLLRDKSMK